jgi:hypothetical protein
MVASYGTSIRERRGPPVESVRSGRGPKLNVHVIFTTFEGTRTALKVARKLAHGLSARITVLVAQVVPYPVPLESPPVSIEFLEKTLVRMVEDPEVETTIQVRLCRDSKETIRKSLGPESMVVIGGHARWWPIRDWMLAWNLRRDGHHLIYAASHDNF